MATPWKDVASSPAYQALPPEQQNAAREQYFAQVVAPQLGNDPNAVQQAKSAFDAQYGQTSKQTPANTPEEPSVRAVQVGSSMTDGIPTATYSPAANQRAQPGDSDYSSVRLPGILGDINDAGNELGRAAVMTGRDVLHGTLAIPGLVHDASVMTPYNAIASAVGSNSRINPAGQQIDANLNAIGIPNPQPENATERVVSGIDQGLGGVMTGAGIGGMLANAPNAIAQGVGNTLTSNIGNQVASVATGAGSAGLAHEAGASPIVQTIAGLAGGVLPSVPAIAQAGTQLVMRGGEAGRQKVAQNIADFAGAGTTPSVGQATQNARTQGLESLLAKTPGAAGVMRNAAQNQGEQVSSKLGQIAENLSPGADSGAAGQAITQGISGPGGYVDRFKQASNDLYNQLGSYIGPTDRIDVTNTLAKLPELNDIIEGAPELSKYFQNKSIMGINNALNTDASGASSALTRPQVQAQAEQITANNAAKNQEIMQANTDEAQRIASINSLRTGQAPVPFTPKPLISPEQTQDQINQMASGMADGQMPYQAVQKLRTLVGNKIADNQLVSDVPRSKWKAVYAALSGDLQNAATQAGPDAESSWNNANQFYQNGMNRIDVLQGIANKTGGPESVFNAAMSGTKDGATTLNHVMDSLQPDQQKVVSASVINRMGKATPGQQNASGDEFSMGTFLTNWNKLSPQAKSSLFGRYGPQFSGDMDKIANVASNVRSGSKVYANPSGTAGSYAGVSALTSGLVSAFTGHPGVAAAIAGGATTANLTARLMTNPKFVNMLAQKVTIPTAGQAVNAVNQYQTQQQNIGNRIAPNSQPAGNISNQLQVNP